MSPRLGFGQGGRPTQWYLPGTDPESLPFPNTDPPADDALTGKFYAPPTYNPQTGSGRGPLFNGLVEAINGRGDGIQHYFDVVGGWNSVKNAVARSDTSERMRFDGFVQVDIELGGELYGSRSIVEVIGAKRGNIVTGASSDQIIVEMLSNETVWNNEFRIATGDGDDTVTLRGLDRALKLLQGDATYARFAGTIGVWDTSGDNTATFVDLGAGTDTFHGHGSADTVIGGAGNDFAAGGGGLDTFVLSGVQAGYTIRFASDRWFITDIDATDGDDGADQIAGFEHLRFGDGTVLALPAIDPDNFIRLADIALGLGGFRLVASVDRGGGRSVAGAGDLNGDGLADLLVSGVMSDGFNPGLETTFLVFGKAGGEPVQLDDLLGPDSELGFAMTGAGTAVAGPGDVNGDGVPDLLMSNFASYSFDFNPVNPAGYVVFGVPEGVPLQLYELDAGTSTLGFKLATTNSDAYGGFTVAGAGDVNGDGLADLLVAAPSEALFLDDGNFREIGGTYVVFGKADGAAVRLRDIHEGIGESGFSVLGVPRGSIMGQPQAVAGAGDVNGDGFDDLLITNTPYAEPGTAYLVFGKADTAPVDIAAIGAGTSTGGFAIATAGLGSAGVHNWSAAAAGDVNGDGRPDLLLGVHYSLNGPFGEEQGAAFVVFGKADSTPVDLAEIAGGTSDLGFMMLGTETSDKTGAAVAGAGDVNGDGLADLLIGAPGDDSGAFEDAGAVYIVFGKADGTSIALADIAAGSGAAGLKILGAGAGEGAGFAVAGAGDVNGDGLPDVLVGASGAYGAGTAAYVIFGQADWLT